MARNRTTSARKARATEPPGPIFDRAAEESIYRELRRLLPAEAAVNAAILCWQPITLLARFAGADEPTRVFALRLLEGSTRRLYRLYTDEVAEQLRRLYPAVPRYRR